MTKRPRVTVACFADEYSYHVDEQIAFARAWNMPISVRFISFDDEARLSALDDLDRETFDARTKELKAQKRIKHICDATEDELRAYKEKLDSHGVMVWDIGSRIGKQYLGARSWRKEFGESLDNSIYVADFLGTQRIRIFSFYPGADNATLAKPGSKENRKYRQQALAYIIAMDADLAAQRKVGFLEVEEGLIGRDGSSLMNLLSDEADVADSGSLFAYFDGANIVRQDEKRKGLSFHSYGELHPGFLGGMHVKDSMYWEPGDRSKQWNFTVPGQGDAGYERIIANHLAQDIPDIEKRLVSCGLPREFGLVLEPHLKCGGQFGGYTGSLYNSAILALTEMLDRARIGHNVRTQ